ncbi:MAG: hypothetical protein E6J89_13535 [Deltaproteobacteria bacterium]|nr:MAG: hypothetical protein E6J89_13535 [Deltaproteobacteria bacterium]
MNRRKLLLAKVTQALIVVAGVMLATGPRGSTVSAQERTAPFGSAPAERPRIDIPVALPLEEARIIIDAAVALVKAEKGRAAIAVVDFNGNVISMDSMDGSSRFWARFAVGKAVGAVALQVDTAVSAEQSKTNPARFQSALSMLGGEVILIPGGLPLTVDGIIIGAVGSRKGRRCRMGKVPSKSRRDQVDSRMLVQACPSSRQSNLGRNSYRFRTRAWI